MSRRISLLNLEYKTQFLCVWSNDRLALFVIFSQERPVLSYPESLAMSHCGLCPSLLNRLWPQDLAAGLPEQRGEMGKRPVLWLCHDQAPGRQEVNFSHKHKDSALLKQVAELFVHMKHINRQNNNDKHVTVTMQQFWWAEGTVSTKSRLKVYLECYITHIHTKNTTQILQSNVFGSLFC